MTRQLHALESLADLYEHADAYAGRAVVCVTFAVVYVAQKLAAAADDAVKTEAQASLSGLSQASISGRKVLRRKSDRILTRIALSLGSVLQRIEMILRLGTA